MKTLDNQAFAYKGKPVLGEDGNELMTVNLIQIILENSQYENSRDIIRASKIISHLEVVKDGQDKEKINLEDEDFKFIKHWGDIYPPVVNKGLIFLDFYKQLED